MTHLATLALQNYLHQAQRLLYYGCDAGELIDMAASAIEDFGLTAFLRIGGGNA